MTVTLPGPVVSAAWLAEHQSHVRIIDSRWSIPTGPKHEDYLQAHIPGAVFSNLDTDASAPAGDEGRHPLPTPEDFAAARSRLGIAGPVVIYDDCHGGVAARLWWLLDCVGVSAAVLEGGLQAWTAMGQATAAGDEPPEPVPCAPVPWPTDRFVSMDQVLPAIEAGAVLIDARSAERFRGEDNPIDRIAGHIPGSHSRPWQSNLGENGFLPADQLRQQLLSTMERTDRTLICSCGSGVTACHNILATRLAGLPTPRLFTGSWSQWTFADGQPIATDTDAN